MGVLVQTKQTAMPCKYFCFDLLCATFGTICSQWKPFYVAWAGQCSLYLSQMSMVPLQPIMIIPAKASLLNKSSSLAPTLGVTKFTIARGMIFSYFFALRKSDLDLQQTHIRGVLLAVLFLKLINYNYNFIVKYTFLVNPLH